MSGTEAFWYNLAISVASAVYQRYQSRKQKAASDAAADKQKGFQLVTENSAQPIPVCYGRFKVGGTRVYHKVSNDYVFAAPPSANSNFFLSTGDLKTEAIGPRAGLVEITRLRTSGNPIVGTGDAAAPVFQEYDSGPITQTFNLFNPTRDVTLPAGGWNSSNEQLRLTLLNRDAIVEYGGDRVLQFNISAVGPGEAYVTLATPLYVDNMLSGSLNDNISDTKREFLFIQQTISFGNLSEVTYVDVDDKSFDHTDYTYGQRIHVHYNGSEADPLATANGIPDTNVFTNIAYLTGVFRLNRDDPNYNGIPQVTSYGEGVMVRPITSSTTIGSARVYSNNQAELILDYLTHPIYGRKVPDSRIDIPSFYRAKRIIDKVVQEITTPFDADMAAEDFNVNGKYWREKFRRWKDDHATGDIFTRQIKLYEFNGIIDTGVPLRDNIEIFLQSIGLADLIWSGGKFKLKVTYAVPYVEAAEYVEGDIVQYDNPGTGHPELWMANTTTTDIPGSSSDWDQEHVAVITDEDLDNDAQVSISWPTLQNKLNRCTINFLNESHDFDEDSVSWPPRNGAIHTTYLAEDNGIILEKSLFANGCSDKYHAQAIAEQEVRLSRDLVVYGFSLSPKWSGIEPGDVIVLKSSRLGIPGELLKIESVKLKENVFVEVQAIKFDARQLAWNAKDEEIVPPRNVYDYAIKQATNLSFTETGAAFPTQSGVLTWNSPDDNRVRGFKIMYTPDSIYEVGENTEWREIGSTSSGVTRFETPPVPTGHYTLAVVSVGFDGTLAPELDFLRESRWPTIDCEVVTGAVGSDNSFLILKSDSPGFTFASSASTTALAPSLITFVAELYNVSTSTVVFTAEAFDDGGTSLGSVTLTSVSATVATLNSAQFTTHAGTRAVRVTASLGLLTDSTTVFRGNDGENVAQMYLDNESFIVPTSADGLTSDYSNSNTNVLVYEGITNATSTWSISISDIGMDTNINGVAGPITGTGSVNVEVSGMVADTGQLVITATKTGWPTITKVITVHKVRDGFDGVAVKSLQLKSNTTGFLYQDDLSTTAISPSITFTAVPTNIVGSITWSAFAFNSSNTNLGAVTLTGTGLSRTLTSANFNAYGSGTDVSYVTVSITGDSESDVATINRVNGGADAFYLELTNPAHPVPTLADGSSGDYSLAYTEVILRHGLDIETSEWTFTRTNTNTTSLFDNGSSTMGPGSDPVYLAVTNLTADTGKVTITATKAGYPSVSRDMVLAKSKQGLAGQALILKSNGFAFVFPDSASTVSSSYDILFEAVLVGITGTVTFIAEGFSASNTSLGVRSMTSLSATTASLSASQFVDNDGASARYVKVTASCGGFSDFEYVNRGDANSNLVQIRLSNPFITVNTDIAGANGDYTNANSLVQVYEGITNTTSDWSYSIAKINVDGTINGNSTSIPSGSSTVTVAVTDITADAGSITVIASRSGYTSVSITLFITRNKAGNNIDLTLTPPIINLPTDTAGIVTTYTGAFSDAVVLESGVNVNADYTFSKQDYGVSSTLSGNRVIVTEFGGVTSTDRGSLNAVGLATPATTVSTVLRNNRFFAYLGSGKYIMVPQTTWPNFTSVFRVSTDHGATWSDVSVAGRSDLYFGYYEFSLGQYSGTYQGFVKSVDNGNTWSYTQINSISNYYVTHMVEQEGYIYALYNDTGRLYKSDHLNDTSWTDMGTVSGSINARDMFSINGNLVILGSPSGSYYNVSAAVSTNGGVSWTTHRVNPVDNFLNSNYVSGTVANNRLYVVVWDFGVSSIYTSLDGKTWTFHAAGPVGGANGVPFKYINGLFWMGGYANDGQVYVSKDAIFWELLTFVSGSDNVWGPSLSGGLLFPGNGRAPSGKMGVVGSSDTTAGLRFTEFLYSIRDIYADTAFVDVTATNTTTSAILTERLFVTKAPLNESLVVVNVFPSVVTLPSSSDGVVSSFDNSAISISIKDNGAESVGLYTASYITSDSGITLSGSNGNYTITAFPTAVSNGTITFTFTRTGYKPRVVQVSVNKILGPDVSGTRVSGSFSTVATLGGFISLKLLTNGDAHLKRTSSGSFVDAGDWYYPNQTNIGNSWYVKIVTESGAWTTDPSAGSWIQLNTDQVWELTRGSPGTSTVVAKVFYNQAPSDTGVVQYSRITLETTVL